LLSVIAQRRPANVCDQSSSYVGCEMYFLAENCYMFKSPTSTLIYPRHESQHVVN